MEYDPPKEECLVARKRKSAVRPAICFQNLCWQKVGSVLERKVPNPASSL